MGAGGPQQAARFSPYEFNGGTALGISGDDFAVVAADTRLSEGYGILSRSVSKARLLTPRCVVATGGCWTDVATLHRVLAQTCDAYKSKHECDVATPGVAQMLGNTLYGRRFFPYYAFNVVAGLDADGKASARRSRTSNRAGESAGPRRGAPPGSIDRRRALALLLDARRS